MVYRSLSRTIDVVLIETSRKCTRMILNPWWVSPTLVKVDSYLLKNLLHQLDQQPLIPTGSLYLYFKVNLPYLKPLSYLLLFVHRIPITSPSNRTCLLTLVSLVLLPSGLINHRYLVLLSYVSFYPREQSFWKCIHLSNDNWWP